MICYDRVSKIGCSYSTNTTELLTDDYNSVYVIHLDNLSFDNTITLVLIILDLLIRIRKNSKRWLLTFRIRKRLKERGWLITERSLVKSANTS